MLQLMTSVVLEPGVRNERSHCSEKPVHHDKEQPLSPTAREGQCAATKTQRNQK